MNLLAWRWRGSDDFEAHDARLSGGIHLGSIGGGMLASIAVALTGNLQILLEWLYAQGVDVSGIAR